MAALQIKSYSITSHTFQPENITNLLPYLTIIFKSNLHNFMYILYIINTKSIHKKVEHMGNSNKYKPNTCRKFHPQNNSMSISQIFHSLSILKIRRVVPFHVNFTEFRHIFPDVFSCLCFDVIGA